MSLLMLMLPIAKGCIRFPHAPYHCPRALFIIYSTARPEPALGGSGRRTDHLPPMPAFIELMRA